MARGKGTGRASEEGIDMEPTDLERFLARARELGALDAKVIDPRTVATAAWVRMKCRYGCGGYNQSYCCPPRTPTPPETRQVLDCYSRAVLIHCNEDAEPTRIVADLEREIFLSGYYRALGFGSGPCDLCQECAMDECTQPSRARPAMEACGIDVFATAHANGFEIEVVRDRSCAQNYFGLVLVE